MAIEHVNIPDSERHEPRGASAAALGEAYISNGEGSGSWQAVVKSTDIPSANFSQMLVSNNSTVLPLTGAEDPSLNTNSDYTKWVLGWEEGLSGGTAIEFDTDHLVINESGIYNIDLWACIETVGGGSVDKLFALKIFTTNANTDPSTRKVLAQSDFSGDIRNPSIVGGKISLQSGDSISLWIAVEDSVDIAIREGSISISKVT